MSGIKFLSTLALGLLFTVGTANATPVTYTVDSSQTMISADVSANLAIQVNTNLGTVNGNASGSGSLSSNGESGSATIEWGVPAAGSQPLDDPGAWFNQLDVDAGDMNLNTGSVGSVNGGATLDLFGFIPVNFDLTVDVDNISLGLGSDFSGALPLEGPGKAGDGPWVAFDAVDLLLGATFDFNATGPFGINIGGGNTVTPTTIPGLPLAITLERTGVSGANPRGTGSQIGLPLPGLNLSIGPLAPTNISTPGCEVDASLACALNVTSVTLTLTSLDFTNVSGNLVATSNAIIPEPGTLGLIGIGLVGLGIVGRRRR